MKEAKPKVSEFTEQKAPSAANKVVKRGLDKKKTVKDNKGDVWELTEKRDTFLIERDANSSDARSELSYDWLSLIILNNYLCLLMEGKKTICLFDMDNTLTPPRNPIKQDMIDTLKAL